MSTKTVDVSEKDINILNQLYNNSALTLEGLDANDVDSLMDALEDICGVENRTAYIISGAAMNAAYKLTGNNAYPDDLTIVCVKLDDLKSIDRLITARFSFGGRWFDDVVENNAAREEANGHEGQRYLVAQMSKRTGRLVKHASAETPAWVEKMNDAFEELYAHVEQESAGCYDISFYTDAGEDFHTSVHAADAEDFAHAMYDAYMDFDPEEHVTMWLNAKESGTSGVPDVITLVHDAEAIEKWLEQLSLAAHRVADEVNLENKAEEA